MNPSAIVIDATTYGWGHQLQGSLGLVMSPEVRLGRSTSGNRAIYVHCLLTAWLYHKSYETRKPHCKRIKGTYRPYEGEILNNDYLLMFYNNHDPFA